LIWFDFQCRALFYFERVSKLFFARSN
jgi:hypothetical protein